MSLPRYPAYRDGGVEWLGAVPAHWHLMKLRRCVALNPSKGEAAHVPRDSEVTFLPMEAVGEDGRLDLSRTRAISEVETGYTYFRDGDVAIAKITPCFENGKGALMVGLAQGIGFGTTELIVIRPDRTRMESSYLNWLVRSPVFRLQGEASMYGAGGQKRVPDDFVRDLQWAVPPLDEQCAIAAFLDRETAKIDALIAGQEKLVALLAEKRQATISHAVTRGLNPDAPMKDSGVPWLGEVPAHWRVTRLKFIAVVQTGIAKGKDTSGKETIAVPYLRVANVQDGYLALEDIATIDIEVEQLERYRLAHGDVLMNEGGDYDKLGRGAIWRGEIPNCIHQNHVFAVRPHGVSSGWLNHVTSSQYAQFYFMGRSKQSTNLASISSANIMELPVVLPPEAEQEAIQKSIEFEIKKLDGLTAQSEQAIRLLKERRSALIAAAVTGQIDVRGAVPTCAEA